MVFINVIGWLATIISIFFLLPQIYKAFKTMSARDLSIVSDLIGFISNVLWIFYSLFKHDIDWKLFITNFLIMLTTLTMLIYQIIWNIKHKDELKENRIIDKAKRLSNKALIREINIMKEEIK